MKIFWGFFRNILFDCLRRVEITDKKGYNKYIYIEEYGGGCMNSEYKEIFPGVHLRVVQTDKFKTGCFSVNFLDKLSCEFASLNALLPMVLCRGSKKMPDMESIAKVTDNLYGAKLEPIVRKFGGVQAFGIVCDCIDGRYTDAGSDLLVKCIELAGEVLFNPLVKKGEFLSEYVLSEAENLKDDIRSEINEKLSYAYKRAMNCMYNGNGFGISEMGDLEQVDAITPKSLYLRYQQVIKNAPVEIFFCGNASFEDVESIVLKEFKALKGRETACVNPSGVYDVSEQSEVIEQMDMAQAVLLLGVLSNITYASEEFYAMRLLSVILGGGTASKLFSNVREKHSLCYYTGTRYDRFSGSMFMYCGVDPEKVDKARAEMIYQLRCCLDGAIDEDEIKNAKRQLLNQLKTVNDSPYLLENYWLNEALCKTNTPTEKAAAIISGVCKDEIINSAKACQLKLTYLLTGKGENVHERKYLHGN